MFSPSVMSHSLQPHRLQQARFPYPSRSPVDCSNSCPLNQWCHSTISSSVMPFPSCLQYFPALGSFLMAGCSLEGLMLKLKLQYFGHLMQKADSLEKTLMLGRIEGRRRRRWQKMRWLDSITDIGQEFEQAHGDGEGQWSLACCSPWGCKESDTT